MRAFERLRAWLVERIAYLTANPQASYNEREFVEEVKWTGDTINLVEIAFGIFEARQLNNGTASIGDIFRWLEKVFHLNLGIPSKRFAENRRRKAVSPVKFLEEMAKRLRDRLYAEDSI